MQNFRLIGVIVFVLILITAGVIGFKHKKSNLTLNKNKRQAITLTTGQVYFGYMKDPNAEYVALQDPFYPQSEQSNVNSRRNVTLVPLSESYTTENIMYINRKEILHFENLADDSKINTAIENFKNNVTSPTPAPLATATPSPSPSTSSSLKTSPSPTP